jgi:hypothetical protein
LQARPGIGSTTADLETLRARLRAFGERQRAGAATEAGSLRALRDPELPEILPLDSTKTFVGTNSSYYDESWRVMEWRGVNRSWNWAAALSLGGWLAYRRLYHHAALQGALLTLLILLALSGAPIQLVALAQLVVALVFGWYGNALYRRRFRQAAVAAARQDGDHAARLAALAASGGTDSRAVWVLAAALAAVAAALVAFREAVGGVRLTF